MNSIRQACGLALFGILIAAPSTLGQQDDPVRKGIDPATVVAWEKLGARYHTKIGVYISLWQWLPAEVPIDKDLPGFGFWSLPKARLPDVAVPFGLDLYYS